MVVYDNQEPQNLLIESKHHPEVNSKVNIPDLTSCSVPPNQLSSSNLVQEVILPETKKKTSKPSSRNGGGNMKKVRAPRRERRYTPEQLATAVDLVIEKKDTPAQVIKRFNIVRRTFFRHLYNKRKELGLLPEQEIKDKVSSGSASTSIDEEEPSETLIHIYNEENGSRRPPLTHPQERTTWWNIYSWDYSQPVCSPSTSRGVSIGLLKSK